jgi:hypothetical protein
MASNINTTQINIYYPVAGQDNDTQGFRTNFQNIQSALNTAANEITALQISENTRPTVATVSQVTTYSVGAGNIAYDSGNLYVTTSPINYLRIPTATGLYSNTNVASYLSSSAGTTYITNLVGSINYANANVSAFLNSGSLSSNVTTSGSLNLGSGSVHAQGGYYSGPVFGQSFLYSNGVSILTGIGSTYSNVNTAAYLTSQSITPYANSNVASYLTTLSLNPYANSNVASYLPVYSGNITASNVLTNNHLFANGVSILNNITANTANTATTATYVTGLTASNVTTALGANPVLVATTATYVTGLTSANVTTALGSNPVPVAITSTYVTGLTASNVTTALGTTPVSNATTATYVTGLTSANVTGVLTSSSVQLGSLGVGTAASGTSGEIRATNNITAYYSSDATLKENIRPIPNALATVVAIGGMLFDWRDSYIQEHGGEDGYFIQKSDFGVIAQDVLANFPLATRTRPDGTLAVDYEKLSALSFAALVEVSNRLDKLEGK